MQDKVVTLGLSGGPKLDPNGAEPALALVVSDQIYLVDCGMETAKQLVRAGLGFSGLRNIFITHNHLDHTSGILGVLVHGWTNLGSELPQTVNIFGPTPTSRLKALSLEAHANDIENYVRGGGFSSFPIIETHDVVNAGTQIIPVMEDEFVRVTATKVFHGAELQDSFAFRFDIKLSGKSVVFSGDTAAPDANLIALATDCDFLFHETQDNENVEKIVSRIPAERQHDLRAHLVSSHSSVEDLPGVALAANAKNLVFCHYTPLPQSPEVYLQKAKRAAAQVGYRGQIIAPTELDVIPI